MPEFTEITVREGSQGLLTNASAIDSAKNSFRVLKNCRIDKPGLIRNIAGYSNAPQVYVNGSLTSIPALPSGFTFEKGFIYHVTQPAETDVVIIFGSKSSRDRFYVWPSIYSSGAWVTDSGSKVSNASINWLELTEIEPALVVNAVTDSTHFTLTGVGNSTSNDYYNGWWFYNHTQSFYDYILDYDSSTGVFTTRYGTALSATNDEVNIFRFPIFKKSIISASIPYYLIDNLPFFVTHGEDLTIHTGAHDINNGPDLKLRYIGTDTANQGFFNDSNLDYNGWHFDNSHPWRLRTTDLISAVTQTGASDDPIPYSGSGTDYYIVEFVALYDGRQGSTVFSDKTALGAIAGAISAATQHFSIQLNFSPLVDTTRQSEYATGTSVPTLFSRFVTRIYVFMAKAEIANSSTGTYRPTTDWFFVKDIDIDDSNWSLATTNYQLTTTIKGTDWKAAQQFPFSAVQGYEGQKIGANAEFEAQAGGRSIIAPIYDDTKKLYRALFSPIRLSGETAPDTFPPEFRIDTYQEGVYDIEFIMEQYGRLLLIGKNTTLIATVSGENKGLILEQLQKIGIKSWRTAKNIDGNVYFSSEDSPLEMLDGTRFAVPSPGFAIKDIWDALTNAQKAAAFAGYHKNSRTYVIKMGSRILLYDTRFNTWSEYETDITFVDFFEGLDGQLFGATTSAIYELFDDTPTESLACTGELQVFNGTTQHFKRLRTQYKSSALLKMIPIDDNAPSTLREKPPAIFLPQSVMEDQEQAVSFLTSRASIKFQTAASTAPGLEIEQLGFAVTPKREK